MREGLIILPFLFLFVGCTGGPTKGERIFIVICICIISIICINTFIRNKYQSYKKKKYGKINQKKKELTEEHKKEWEEWKKIRQSEKDTQNLNISHNTPGLNFTAIDFETMTPKRTSACSIGLVKVKNGEIVDKFYSLIKPVPDDSHTTNTMVHGITPEMVEDAPTFEKVWPTIESFIGNDPIIAHNASFDKSVLLSTSEYYNLKITNYLNFFCTYKLTGYSLDEACRKYNISLDNHHAALDDAIACAMLYLKLIKQNPENVVTADFQLKGEFLPKQSFGQFSDKDLFREIYYKRSFPSGKIEMEKGYLYNKNVIITGQFAYYSDLKIFKEQLNYYGVKIQTKINKETDIIILGKYGSDNLVNKARKGIKGGKQIVIMKEIELKKHIHPQPTILQCEEIIKNELIPLSHKIYEDDVCSSSIRLTPIDYVEGFYPEDEILDKTTIFYNKRVNVRGLFKGYDKNYGVEKILQKLGADVRFYMNSKTEIIVVSDEFYDYWGPTGIIDKSVSGKINLDGIKIVKEKELNEIIKNSCID